MSTRTEGELRFGPYRLAGPHGPLRAAHDVVALPPKPLAMLLTLIHHAGEVVTKDQLLAAVWPDVIVTDGVISACLRDLRRALHDDPRNPSYIATAHRIGYRFIAEVTREAPSTQSGVQGSAPPPSPFVGRDIELARLHTTFDRCRAGQRQLVFVTGDAGIGKTELVDTFLAQLEPARQPADGPGSPTPGAVRPIVTRGQCIEHYGAGEPYMPMLEALARLCRSADGGRFVTLLRRYAPTWLMQLPGLLDDNEALALQLATAGSSGERMLREIVEAVELAAAPAPLVLVLEDMHWSDPSTVDWLSALARRREAACLLVIVTCRPVELIVDRHPLKTVKQELVSRAAASEILLGYLTPGAVQSYVARRLPGSSAELASAIYRRSQGHPLFMVHLIDDLESRPFTPGTGECVHRPERDAAVPNSVRELIEIRVERLEPEQLAALEAASVAGLEFAAASVAAGLQCPPEQAENRLEELARREQFVEARGLSEWHDGTVSGCYGFRHDLYRETLYHRLGAARRAQLHARIGERLALAHGSRTSEIAAELALHFEFAKEAGRAARYYREAAEMALRRCAYRGALAHIDKGLALLGEHPDDVDAERAELLLRLTQGAALLAIEGFGSQEVETTYLRAQDLSRRLDDTAALAPVLSGLWNLHLTRAAFEPARDVARQLFELADSRPDPTLSMLAHNLRGQELLFVGEPAAALAHVEPSLALYDLRRHRLLAVEYGEDPGVVCHHCACLTNLILGHPETAAWHLGQGFDLARELAHPFSEAQMLWMDALVCLEIGNTERLDETTSRLIALCVQNEFPLWLAGGRMLRGSALAFRGQPEQGLELARQGLQEWRASGTLLMVPYSLAVVATLCAWNGCIAEATQLLDEALDTTHRTGERWYEAELYRLRGEMSLQQADRSEFALARARACFQRSIGIARQQQARLFELRAVASLARISEPPANTDSGGTGRSG